MHTHAILFNNDFLSSKNFIRNKLNRHPSQLTSDINLFYNNFDLFDMFLTNCNNSAEFSICSGILSGEWLYHMDSSLSMCNINPRTGFCMVGYFFGDYSQTDCNFNFNINVNVTVDIYLNSSFNFSFSQLLNDLLSFRIMKLGSTSNITAKCETICFFFSLFFCLFLRDNRGVRLTYFLIAFVYLWSLSSPSP